MTRRLSKRIIWILGVVAICAGFCVAQKSVCLSDIVNPTHCQIEPEPLEVRRLWGYVVSSSYRPKPGEHEKKEEFLEDFCVVLFRRDDMKLVSSTITNRAGRFRFKNVSPGDYYVVAKFSESHDYELTPSLIPLTVTNGRAGANGIKIHLVPLGMHSCSVATAL